MCGNLGPTEKAASAVRGSAPAMRIDDETRPASRDWDEASHAVSSAYFAHRLRPAAHTDASHMTVSGVQFDGVRIARIGWGALVDVETEHRGGVAVNVPLSGSLHSVIGREDLLSTPHSATVYPADTPVLIRQWSPTCNILGVRFDRDFLVREVARVAGGSRKLPNRIHLDTPAGKAWFQLVAALHRQPALPASAQTQLAGAIADSFVLALLPDESPTPAAPGIVRRVVDRIEAAPELPWTAGDMAAMAGVSVRRLQEGFRSYLGESPREHLVRVRLSRAHADLLDARGTVAEVAAAWGFGHLGRFASDYRRAYGEKPSDTLRGS